MRSFGLAARFPPAQTAPLPLPWLQECELKALAEYSMKGKSFRGNAISILYVFICMTWL